MSGYLPAVLPLLSFFAALVIAGPMQAVPACAQVQDLKGENVWASASFPCKAEQQESKTINIVIGNILVVHSKCTKAKTVFVLAIIELSESLAKYMSSDELLDITLDDARSKSYVKIISTERVSLAGSPAMKSHVLDTRQPQTATKSLAVISGHSIAITMVTASPDTVESDAANDFLNSLNTQK